MRGTPALVLVGGLVSTGYGIVCLLLAGHIEGLVGLAIPITVLGLALIGMAFYAARRPPAPERPPDAPPAPPARWIPYALGVILAAQFVWTWYWIRHH